VSPAASVLMPVRDAAEFVREALDSILAQTVRDLEVIVVDDGSRDATPDILAEYVARDPRVRLVRQEPRGLAAALNRAAEEARGELLARMDADDVALPHRLERQLGLLRARPRVGVVGSAFRFLGEAGRSVAYPARDADIRRALETYNAIAHPTAVIRAAALREVGGYRLANAEDYDLWLRLAERWELANLSEPLLLYRHHPRQFSVSSIRAQAVGALAVQTAARARRAGRPDPLDGVHDLTASVIERLGLDPEELRLAERGAVLRWVAALAEGGEQAAARELLREESPTRDRALAAQLRLERAKAALRAGRRVRALRHAAVAAALDPPRALRELRRARRPSAVRVA
jgi:hypothetical protein